MRSLKTQVLGFLNSGGYRSAKSAQDVVLVRSRSYRWSSGEIDRNRIMLGSFSGFEIEEIPEGVLVRFAGPGVRKPDRSTGTHECSATAASRSNEVRIRSMQDVR